MMKKEYRCVLIWPLPARFRVFARLPCLGKHGGRKKPDAFYVTCWREFALVTVF
jgi:hypothetical protein